MNLSDTMKSEDAVGSGNGEETWKYVLKEWCQLSTSEGVKGELAEGQAVTTSAKCALQNYAETAFPEMPQQVTVS